MRRITLLFVLSVYTLNGFSQSFGNAMRLDGQNDLISIPNDVVLDASDNITFEAWIKPCDTLGFQSIFSRSDCNNTYGYSLSLSGGQLVWIWSTAQNCSSKGRYRSAVSLQPNVWQHVAVVHSTSTGLQYYLNGQPIPGTYDFGSFVSNIWIAQLRPILVGAATDGQSPISSYFDGFIDEVRIWNDGLSPSEILARYNSALSGNEADLVAYYNMDANTVNGSGQTIINNATATGNILDAQTFGTPVSPSFNMHTNSSCGAAPNSVVDYFAKTITYPNPVNNKVLVELGRTIQEISVTLYTATGQTLLEEDYKNVESIQINMYYPKGLYFLKLKASTGDLKLIKLLRD